MVENKGIIDEIVNIDGIHVRVRRKGEGQPLLWLHGPNGNKEWSPMLERLSQYFDVIAPDHPGFGDSDRPTWLTDFEDLVYFYRAFLNYFEIDKTIIMGHSLGGWIAAEFAASQTHRVEKLVLTAADGLWIDGVEKIDTFPLNQEQIADLMFYNEELREKEKNLSRSEKEQDMIIRNRVGHTRLMWNRPFNPKFNQILKWIDLPTLIIWGEEDQLISPKYAQAFAELIPKSQIKMIKECGHYPHIEKKDEYMNIVINFLGR